MTGPHIADATLMALADGELADADAQSLRAQIAADPILAARFALFVETRALVRQAAREGLTAPSAAGDASREPVSVGSLQPKGFPAAERRHAAHAALARRWRRWQLPIAACVLLTVGGIAGFMLAPRGAGQNVAMASAILALHAAEPALAQSLDRVPSGQDVHWSAGESGLSGRIVILSTHRLGDATYCREYEISFAGPLRGAVVGASCRRNGVWRAEIAAAKPPEGSGYAPASGVTAVDQYLASLGSPGPLSSEDERARLAQGW